MLNIQNLLSQMMASNNPVQLASSLLNPQQRQILSQFQNLSNEQQAQKIADLCNQKGITKDQLAQLINQFRRK